MPIKHLISPGIGFSPGSPKYIVTRGLSIGAETFSGTYHSYVSAGGFLRTIVKGVEVSRQHKITGNADYLNDLSAQARDVLRYALLNS